MRRPTEYVAADEGATSAPGAAEEVEPSASSTTAAPGAEAHDGSVGAVPLAGTGARAEANASTDAGAETRPDVEHAPGTDRTSGPEPDPTTPTVLVIELLVTNGTDTDVNTSIFVAVTSAGEDAEEYFEPGSGLTGPPGTMLPPGGEVRFSLAFAVQDPGDLTVEVRPAYHYDVAVFEGGAD